MSSAHFIDRAEDIYGYANFVCDSGGSICEVVDPDDPDDPVLTALGQSVLLVGIEGSEAHAQELVRRFDAAPKPMCYQPTFLAAAWQEYLGETGQPEDKVDPDAFVRWAYARALAHRQPRYAAMARNWGISVTADQVAAVRSVADFQALIAAALPA